MIKLLIFKNLKILRSLQN